MKTLTKTNIEELAQEIITFLEKRQLANSVSIYFNNKVVRDRGDYDKDYNYIPKWETTENIDPHDYFDWAAYDHILSMSFEGDLYNVLNYSWGKREEEFRAIFERHGLYYEFGNMWNITAYLSDDDIEVEYTKYERPKETIRLSFRGYNPYELQVIMDRWYSLSREVGEQGSSVIGAGFEFEWQDDKYFMPACSPHQGSLSWEAHISTIKEMLEKIGATNIYYDWGRMD